MKIFMVAALTCLAGFRASSQLDTNLMGEINSWQKGDAPPARLLKFPNGKIELTFECGMRVLGSEVEDYVSRIQNADLLAALIFDPLAEADTFHAAVAQLINLRDVGYVSQVITKRRETDPAAFARPEVAVLFQLLRTPYLTVAVARIAPEDMPPGDATRALKTMKRDLCAGELWIDVYRKQSDLHPDLRARTENPKSVQTLVAYLYDGPVSETGFDLVTYATAEALPVAHLRELFHAKRGTHILQAANGVFLYHIRNYYDPKTQNQIPQRQRKFRS